MFKKRLVIYPHKYTLDDQTHPTLENDINCKEDGKTTHKPVLLVSRLNRYVEVSPLTQSVITTQQMTIIHFPTQILGPINQVSATHFPLLSPERGENKRGLSASPGEQTDKRKSKFNTI